MFLEKVAGLKTFLGQIREVEEILGKKEHNERDSGDKKRDGLNSRKNLNGNGLNSWEK